MAPESTSITQSSSSRTPGSLISPDGLPDGSVTGDRFKESVEEQSGGGSCTQRQSQAVADLA